MVTKYLTQQLELIRDSLDGGNLDSVLSEVGIRFHRTLVEHIYQFVYSSQGLVVEFFLVLRKILIPTIF